MKFSNDYKIIVEEKHYAVFKDGKGIEQKVEISKEVADALSESQRTEKTVSRQNERHTISLDMLDYEGEIFATYDDYQKDDTLSLEEKVEIVLKRMKANQAELLYGIIFLNRTQEEISKEKNVSQQAISQRFLVSKDNFQKIFQKLFPKTLYFGPFLSE